LKLIFSCLFFKKCYRHFTTARYGRYASLNWSDSIRTPVLSISGDSCFLIDSAKTLNLNNYSVGFYSQTRKILNQNFNQLEDPNNLLISSQMSGWSSVAAFVSQGAYVFVGNMPCDLGVNDNQVARHTSTQFPISGSLFPFHFLFIPIQLYTTPLH